MDKSENTKSKFRALICVLLLVAGANELLKSGVMNIPDPPRPKSGVMNIPDPPRP